jgi:divinyl chlorophyllide a 8-vinyl-reductase
VNALNAARAAGARHYILLSAFCVKTPTLAFQKAKLQTEAALEAQTDVTYSIVRPTAFFKSLSGQVEILKGGQSAWPVLSFKMHRRALRVL